MKFTPSMFKLFDLTLKLNGFPMQEAKSELQKIIAIPEEEYSHFIEQKKMEIVNFHLKNNPFYRELVGTEPYWSVRQREFFAGIPASTASREPALMVSRCAGSARTPPAHSG